MRICSQTCSSKAMNIMTSNINDENVFTKHGTSFYNYMILMCSQEAIHKTGTTRTNKTCSFCLKQRRTQNKLNQPNPKHMVFSNWVIIMCHQNHIVNCKNITSYTQMQLWESYLQWSNLYHTFDAFLFKIGIVYKSKIGVKWQEFDWKQKKSINRNTKVS